MNVYLVQHAEALSEEIDPRRGLSDRGKDDVRKVVRALGSLGALTIVHSGKLRAAETAEIIGQAVGVSPTATEGLGPLDDPAIWVGRLQREKGDIMLVGHLPHMGKLASLLLCGDTDAGAVSFSMGGVCCIKRADGADKGRWSLGWMVVPESLKDS